jgi:hypothetical protein
MVQCVLKEDEKELQNLDMEEVKSVHEDNQYGSKRSDLERTGDAQALDDPCQSWNLCMEHRLEFLRCNLVEKVSQLPREGIGSSNCSSCKELVAPATDLKSPGLGSEEYGDAEVLSSSCFEL